MSTTEIRFEPKPEEARILQGRRALVTGGNSGIGQGVVLELAAHGASVAINHVVDSTAAEALAEAVARLRFTAT
jgi:glucose 1-dehydrogenase